MVNKRTIVKYVYNEGGKIVGKWVLINGVWVLFGWPGVLIFKTILQVAKKI